MTLGRAKPAWPMSLPDAPSLPPSLMMTWASLGCGGWQLPAPVIMAIPIHSTERTRLIKTMTDLLLFSPPKGEEVRQIFKVGGWGGSVCFSPSPPSTGICRAALPAPTGHQQVSTLADGRVFIMRVSAGGWQVRLIKLKVSVMALLRMRFYLYGRGDYLCATFALTPIPMHAAPARRIPQGSRRTVLHVPAEADEWVETAHVSRAEPCRR